MQSLCACPVTDIYEVSFMVLAAQVCLLAESVVSYTNAKSALLNSRSTINRRADGFDTDAIN